MTEVVYADVLVALNIYITYILLVSVRLFTRFYTRKFGMALGALIGGFSALIIFAPEMNLALSVLYKIGVAALTVLAAFRPKTFKSFLRAFLVFFGVSFLFGGAMLALELLLHPHGMVYLNGTVYFDVSVLTLVLTTLVCYGIIRLSDHLIRRRAAAKTLYDVTVYFRSASVTCRALLDTGNHLTDGLEGRPVIVAELSAVSALFDEKEKRWLKENSLGADPPDSLRTVLRLIPCRSVSDSGLLLAFLPEKVVISDGKTTCETAFAAVGVTTRELSAGEYRALLNATLFERSEKVEKACIV